jgi:organic hydroperoxide reductase OsmC/OhrA
MTGTTTILKWPVEKQEIKLIDTNHNPEGKTHLLQTKDFSFYASSTSEHQGDDTLLNPEDMLINALSSCFFMTFHAIATKARLGLLSYECDSELFLDGEKVKHISKIVLNLKLKFETEPEKEKILQICEKAHKYCIIANSIKAEIVYNLV